MNPPISSSSSNGTNTYSSSAVAKKDSNWLGVSIQLAKQTVAVGECLPLPYVKGVASVVVSLLETIEVSDLLKIILIICGLSLGFRKLERIKQTWRILRNALLELLR